MPNNGRLPLDVPSLAEGDRVQVSDDCPEEMWRGVTGFIVSLPLDDSDELGAGTCLVEFDEPVPCRYTAESYTGAEILPAYLREFRCSRAN